jgi:hypothetical protein
MPDDSTPTLPGDNTIKFGRAEDFESLYANHTQYESSVWDLKFVFGQLDQGKGPQFIEQHTAMSVSWPQAKLMAYFTLVNLIIHQANNGTIQVPVAVRPPRPDASDPTIQDEAGKNVLRYLGWVHDQFFGSDPYIPPGVDAAKL